MPVLRFSIFEKYVDTNHNLMLSKGLFCLLFCTKMVDFMLSHLMQCITFIHFNEFISFPVQAKKFRNFSAVSVTPNN